MKNEIAWKKRLLLAWENVSKELALKNAKTYYDIRAKERKSLLDEKWYKYNQCQLDSLVAASWWTQKATKNLQTYVLSHRNNPSEVSSYMSTFATTSAWNGKTQPGLVIRRQFESNRFLWKQIYRIPKRILSVKKEVTKEIKNYLTHFINSKPYTPHSL